MALIPTYRQAAVMYHEAWDAAEKTERGSRWKGLLVLTKDCWDKNSRKNREGTTIIKEIVNELGLPNFYILGNFKDLYGMTHEEIYNQWVSTFTEAWVLADDTETSYMKIAYSAMKEIYPYKNLSYQDAVTGICLMLFRSSVGVALESKVIEALQAMHSDCENFEVVPAPSSLECQDVDALVKSKSTGVTLLKISVKTLGALSESFIDEVYRGKLKKSAPQLYVGYRSLDSEKLEYFYRGTTRQEVRALLAAA